MGQPAGRWAKAMVAVVVVIGGVAAARATANAGTRLIVPSGTHIGIAPHPVGTVVGAGMPIETHGGASLVLQSVSARHTSNVSVTFRIARTAPGALGIGTFVGTPDVRGMRRVPGFLVVQPAVAPDRGATWLVVFVRPKQPGRWRVWDFRITYKSWWRTRTAASDFELSGVATPR